MCQIPKAINLICIERSPADLELQEANIAGGVTVNHDKLPHDLKLRPVELKLGLLT